MHILFLISGFCVTLAAFGWLIPFARRIGYVDVPGGRKQHTGQTPLIGGVVILPVFAVLLWLTGTMDWRMAILLGAVAVMFLVGAYDDVAQLNPWIKFLTQIAVAGCLVIAGGAEVRVLGNLFGFGEVGLNVFSIPFSIAALVLLMNALNMIDGLDGLAGGLAAIVLGWLAMAAHEAGYAETVMRIACLLAPLIAFLVMNMRHPFLRKARVFLGDAGSMPLALIVGWFAIDLSQGAPAAVPPAGVMWLLAIPVIDTLTLFFIRTRRGRHPFSPDRNHLHHRLLDKGMPPHWAAPFILLSGFVCGAIGLSGLPQAVLFYSWWTVLLLYAGYSLRSGADRRFD